MSVVEDKRPEAERILRGILEHMGLALDVVSRVEDGRIVLDVRGEEAALVIGRQGQTLDALELLVARMLNRGGDLAPVTIDSEGYRDRRKETLLAMARRLADKARKERRPVAIEGLTPAERRIVHMALAEQTDLSTRSEGEDPYRRLIIDVASAGSQGGAAPDA